MEIEFEIRSKIENLEEILLQKEIKKEEEEDKEEEERKKQVCSLWIHLSLLFDKYKKFFSLENRKEFSYCLSSMVLKREEDEKEGEKDLFSSSFCVCCGAFQREVWGKKERKKDLLILSFLVCSFYSFIDHIRGGFKEDFIFQHSAWGNFLLYKHSRSKCFFLSLFVCF